MCWKSFKGFKHRRVATQRLLSELLLHHWKVLTIDFPKWLKQYAIRNGRYLFNIDSSIIERLCNLLVYFESKRRLQNSVVLSFVLVSNRIIYLQFKCKIYIFDCSNAKYSNILLAIMLLDENVDIFCKVLRESFEAHLKKSHAIMRCDGYEWKRFSNGIGENAPHVIFFLYLNMWRYTKGEKLYGQLIYSIWNISFGLFQWWNSITSVLFLSYVYTL